MFQLIINFIFFYITLGYAFVYFSMTDIKVTIPNDHDRYTGIGNSTVALINAYGDSKLTFSINDTKNLFINSTNGAITFAASFKKSAKIKSIIALISVKDIIGNYNQTTLKIEWINLKTLDCDLIIEDLCYWQSITYRIKENQKPSIIGTLSSSYLIDMCPGYKINYTINKQNNFALIPPSQSLINNNTFNNNLWSIVSLHPIDRDVEKLDKEINVVCTIENPYGTIRDVPRNIKMLILDANDNPPSGQVDEVNIGISSNVVFKGQLVEHSDLIFKDKDSSSINEYETTIIGDNLKVLSALCNKYENDYNKEPQTAIHCKLKFMKNMQIPNSTYSVTLQLTDTKNKNKINWGKIQIKLHFHNESGYHPATIKKQFDKPLNLYPLREVKVFRSAAPLARITQPSINLLKDATNFLFNSDPQNEKPLIFNLTSTEGIVFVHDVQALRTAPEYIRLNITWMRNEIMSFDEIEIRIVDEPTKTCSHVNESLKNWKSCSEYSRPNECESEKACGISTGGSFSIVKRKDPERCMWRGDKNPGNFSTHLYATCTPDTSTCPDGICDSLEKLNYKICPQDCTENVIFPTNKNPKTGRGIDRASGVCSCDEGGCQCNIFKKRNKKKPIKGFDSIQNTTTTTVLENSIKNNMTKAGQILGIEIEKCGTICILGIIAGVSFLLLAISLIVICWRLDRVNKVVRGKFINDDTQDLSAPLSDYVDRTIPDPLPISFNMTTSLTNTAVLNIINKYASDPKWEFPRNQLVIEQTLGEGEFGRVLRAKALNIVGQTGYTTVAVKTLKDDARETELNDLLSEYQLLKEVSHPNVIKLLGVCTTPGGPIYLIIEFAEHGSLRNYLRRSRHLKSENGKLPSSSIDDVDDNYDEPKISQVTPKEILSFAWQICKGMAYLSEIKLVHRDLAARNVLLAEEKICKISDFGLTRDIYEDDAYFKRSKGRVPVKWMAPESLSDHIYTHKSDVWSFGILIWELITLGATPYPGIAVQNLFHLLHQGYRMERPDNCSPTLYNIMRSCWHIDPEQRPTFQQLSGVWEKLLSDQVDYLDLTNNAIHNRSYFCLTPLNETISDKPESNPLNYMSKSQSYVKCGSEDKLLEINNTSNTADPNQNNIISKGYETPINISEEVSTTINNFPQYYTDMAGTKNNG